MSDETCTVCGRPVVSEWGWHPETDVCPRVPITGTRYGGEDFDSRTECYRAGYEREKLRADSAEAMLLTAEDIIAEMKDRANSAETALYEAEDIIAELKAERLRGELTVTTDTELTVAEASSACPADRRPH